MSSMVQNILDNDLYKFIMHQFIFERYPDVEVKWSVINRSQHIRMADEIDELELRRQLDRIKEFRFTKPYIDILNSVWPHFTGDYLDYLQYKFKLSPYTLEVVDGQFQINLEGTWLETTLWEVMILATMSELRSDQYYEFYNQAKIKIQMIQDYNYLNDCRISIVDMGTRRRHSYRAQKEILNLWSDGNVISSTSNVWLAYKYLLPCVGTYAHEIPMVLTALADRWGVIDAQYEYPKYCIEKFGETLILPDTYGSSQFYDNMPNNFPKYKINAIRIDSKDPIVGVKEAINLFEDYLSNPQRKTIICSDGLKVQDILYLHSRFKNECDIRFGWGTDLTNTSQGNASIVCKVTAVRESGIDWEPCVKLSDQYAKATGTNYQKQHYYDIFGRKGIK